MGDATRGEPADARWSLLAGVPADDVAALLAVARRRRCDGNAVVFHRDEPADELHLVATGRFAIRVMTPLGETATIGVRGPGDSFGEMALIAAGGRRSATVCALEDGETVAVRRDAFDGLRRRHPGVNDVLMHFLTGEVRRQNELLLDAMYVPSELRVLRRLVDLVPVYGGAATAEIPLTQDELASLAGTSRTTVNQVLRAEEARGLVRVLRGRTEILDVAALARRAGLPSMDAGA
jgi:CRP/FNR family cyclic AMP-dependent transcriptional regulator